jgi:hypothetical protein
MISMNKCVELFRGAMYLIMVLANTLPQIYSHSASHKRDAVLEKMRIEQEIVLVQ